MNNELYPNVRCVAIWLQLQPHQELMGEGIGTHLARLIKGMEFLGDVDVVICAPTWSKEIVENYLVMYEIKKIVSVKYFGPALGAFLYGLQRSGDSGQRAEKTSGPIKRNINYYFSSLSKFIPVPMFWLGGLLSMPFFVVKKLAYITAKAVGYKIENIAFTLRNAVIESMTDAITDAMAHYIDSKKEIDACIVPIGNWNKCIKIKKKPITVQIPDIVYLEFPEVFDSVGGVEAATASLIRVAGHATRIICPSVYIKEIHHEKLGVPERKSKAVLHAPMLLNTELPLLEEGASLADIKRTGSQVAERFLKDTLFGARFERYMPKLLRKKTFDRMSTKERQALFSKIRPHGVIIRNSISLKNFSGSPHWLTAISDNWGKQDFTIYFPTQNRPYKNILRLIKCIHLLKERYDLNIILMLTGDLSLSPHIVQEIFDLDLYSNVLCLPRLSARIHAAMYARADLTVAASLFEGGFPFLFSEALSVGTPAVMADIPVTKLVLDEALWEATLFDPRSIEDMVRSIHYGLTRGADLLKLQRPFFEKQNAERNWSTVAAEYLQACQEGMGEIKIYRKKLNPELIYKNIAEAPTDKNYLTLEKYFEIKDL